MVDFGRNLLYNGVTKNGGEPMFFGIYNHQLDDKGRLRLPAKLRNELGGSFFCLKGYDNTILVYSEEKFKKFCEENVNIPLTDVEAQRALVELVSNAFPIEEDSQGRFVLPAVLKEYAGIDKNVVIKGVIDRIEIWSEKAHNERTTNKNLNELVVSLPKLNQ